MDLTLIYKNNYQQIWGLFWGWYLEWWFPCEDYNHIWNRWKHYLSLFFWLTWPTLCSSVFNVKFVSSTLERWGRRMIQLICKKMDPIWKNTWTHDMQCKTKQTKNLPSTQVIKLIIYISVQCVNSSSFRATKTTIAHILNSWPHGHDK